MPLLMVDKRPGVDRVTLSNTRGFSNAPFIEVFIMGLISSTVGYVGDSTTFPGSIHLLNDFVEDVYVSSLVFIIKFK
jgi:hypothetical protein